MKVKSAITGKTYEPKNVCRIINVTQLAAYMLAGVELLDIYPSRDRITNKPILVGVVDRKDSYEAYKLWCDYKLDP